VAGAGGCGALFYLLAFMYVYQPDAANAISMAPMLGITGGIVGMLQWSLLGQHRRVSIPWVLLNAIFLGLIGIFNTSDQVIQRALLFTWLAGNLVVGPRLVLGKVEPIRKPDGSPAWPSGPANSTSANEQAVGGKAVQRRLTPPLGWSFWLIWVGVLAGGVGLWILLVKMLESQEVGQSPGYMFIILAALGAIIGLAQWLVMRKVLPGAWWWIAANAIWLGWAAGYANSAYFSDTSVGNLLSILYLAANLVVGPGLIILARRK
jgi:hypothetical protein